MGEYGDLFAPDPLLQEEIDEALESKRQSRQDDGWTSKKGVILDAAALRSRGIQTVLDSRQYAISGSAIVGSYICR